MPDAEMKCVCPSGGDRTCPADCLYRKWQNLSASERKQQRKQHFSIPLRRQGYSQEEIAKQLGVSQSTIGRDLAELFTMHNTNPPQSSRGRNEGRPRGSGRRGGPQPQRRRTDPTQAAAAATRALDEGVAISRAAADAGLPLEPVRDAVERELGRRERRADPPIDPATLSLTAQQKLDAAIRQHKRALDLQFETRVSDEIRRRLEEHVLPTLKQREAEYLKGINAHNGYISRSKYMAMWRCLHPDSRVSVTDRKLAEAFGILAGLERVLIKREDRTTEDPSRWSVDAMTARRQAVSAARRSRSANTPVRG